MPENTLSGNTLSEKSALENIKEDAHLAADTASFEKTKIYSPTQVACGTIGGPVGLVYFLWKNFDTLKKEQMKKNTLLAGGLFILVLALMLPFLPDEIPSTPFTVLYIVIARMVADKYQMTKADIIASEEFDFYSNWRVLFIGLGCLVGSVIVFMVPIFTFLELGLIDF